MQSNQHELEMMKEYRSLNERLMRQAYDNYNKFLITLSSGAIAISLTFIANMFPDKQFSGKLLLYCSWICWLITIVLNVFSFYSSAKSHEKTIKQVNANIINGDNTIHDEKKIGGVYTSITKYSDIVSGVSFIIAIFLFCIFGLLNIK